MKKLTFIIPLFLITLGLSAQDRSGILTTDTEKWFTLKDFKASFQGTKLSLNETKSDGLTFSLPAFQCSLTVTSMAPSGQWSVGFVRVLKSNHSSILWSGGVLNEVLPIVPVNDGDGKNYPWISKKDLKDLPKAKPVQVETRFTLEGEVSWKAPQKDGSFASHEDLTNIAREVNESLYLVAWEAKENRYVFLKEVEFFLGVVLEVDCQKAPGSRTQSTKPMMEFLEVADGENVRIPDPRIITGPGAAESKQLWLNYELWK